MNTTYTFALLTFGGMTLAYYLFQLIKKRTFTLSEHPFFIACLSSIVLHGGLLFLISIKNIDLESTNFFYMKIVIGLINIAVFIIAYKYKYKR